MELIYCISCFEAFHTELKRAVNLLNRPLIKQKCY
jgi:hypothetical protein